VAARAEIAALAREREQVFVRTGVAADAGEAVLEDPTREELIGHLPDDRTPRAVLEKGQLTEALAEYERGQQAAGDTPLFGYVVTLARAGQSAKARAMLERLRAHDRDHYVNPITMVAIHAALGEKEQAFMWLDRTVVDRTGWLWGVVTWKEFETLRQDPRMIELIKRMGIPVA